MARARRQSSLGASSLGSFVHREQRAFIEGLVALGGNYPRCRSGLDGECLWEGCPQKKAYRSGCFLYDWEDPDDR